MNNVSGNPSFIESINIMVGVVINACMVVVPTLVLMTLIVSLAKGFTSGSGVSVNYAPVVRGFILMVTLFFYQELLDIVSAAIGGFTSLLNQPANIYQDLDSLASGDPAPRTEVKPLTGYFDQVVDFFNSFNLLSMLQSFALGGIASIARKIMEIFRQTLLGFLYVTGPIAISLSVLPFFGQLVQKWFQNYLSVQFWGVTLVILDNLVALYRGLSQSRVDVMTGLSISEAAEKLDMVLITLVIAVMYFMVPYLTSFFAGQAQSAIYQAKSMALGVAGTLLAAKGAAMLTGAGAVPAAASLASQGASSVGGAMKGASSPDHTTQDTALRGGAGNAIPVRQ